MTVFERIPLSAKAAIFLFLGILFAGGPVWIDLWLVHRQYGPGTDGPGAFFMAWGPPGMLIGALFLLVGIIYSVCWAADKFSN
jgi:hypothetical protein